MNKENKKLSQEEVWNNIAPEWNKFKTTPSKAATDFLNKSKGNVLDFGSGSGKNLLGIKNSNDKTIYFVDFSNEMLKLAKKRARKLGIKIKTIKSSLEKTNLKDNFFDAAICTASLHCIPKKENREKAVKEIYRILKPGAKAEIEVWNKDSKRFKNKEKEKFISWRDKGERYYYLYDEKELIKLFEKTGFKYLKTIPHKANVIIVVKKPTSS